MFNSGKNDFMKAPRLRASVRHGGADYLYPIISN
jgi:hypothetical protein